MKFGIHLPQFGRAGGPESVRRTAIQAEELGYDDIWVSDHLAIPADAPYPLRSARSAGGARASHAAKLR